MESSGSSRSDPVDEDKDKDGDNVRTEGKGEEEAAGDKDENEGVPEGTLHEVIQAFINDSSRYPELYLGIENDVTIPDEDVADVESFESLKPVGIALPIYDHDMGGPSKPHVNSDDDFLEINETDPNSKKTALIKRGSDTSGRKSEDVTDTSLQMRTESCSEVDSSKDPFGGSNEGKFVDVANCGPYVVRAISRKETPEISSARQQDSATLVNTLKEYIENFHPFLSLDEADAESRSEPVGNSIRVLHATCDPSMPVLENEIEKKPTVSEGARPPVLQPEGDMPFLVAMKEDVHGNGVILRQGISAGLAHLIKDDRLKKKELSTLQNIVQVEVFQAIQTGKRKRRRRKARRWSQGRKSKVLPNMPSLSPERKEEEDSYLPAVPGTSVSRTAEKIHKKQLGRSAPFGGSGHRGVSTAHVAPYRDDCTELEDSKVNSENIPAKSAVEERQSDDETFDSTVLAELGELNTPTEGKGPDLEEENSCIKARQLDLQELHSSKEGEQSDLGEFNSSIEGKQSDLGEFNTEGVSEYEGNSRQMHTGLIACQEVVIGVPPSSVLDDSVPTSLVVTPEELKSPEEILYRYRNPDQVVPCNPEDDYPFLNIFSKSSSSDTLLDGRKTNNETCADSSDDNTSFTELISACLNSSVEQLNNSESDNHEKLYEILKELPGGDALKKVEEPQDCCVSERNEGYLFSSEFSLKEIGSKDSSSGEFEMEDARSKTESASTPDKEINVHPVENCREIALKLLESDELSGGNVISKLIKPFSGLDLDGVNNSVSSVDSNGSKTKDTELNAYNDQKNVFTTDVCNKVEHLSIFGEEGSISKFSECARIVYDSEELNSLSSCVDSVSEGLSVIKKKESQTRNQAEAVTNTGGVDICDKFISCIADLTKDSLMMVKHLEKSASVIESKTFKLENSQVSTDKLVQPESIDSNDEKESILVSSININQKEDDVFQKDFQIVHDSESHSNISDSVLTTSVGLLGSFKPQDPEYMKNGPEEETRVMVYNPDSNVTFEVAQGKEGEVIPEDSVSLSKSSGTEVNLNYQIVPYISEKIPLSVTSLAKSSARDDGISWITKNDKFDESQDPTSTCVNGSEIVISVASEEILSIPIESMELVKWNSINDLKNCEDVSHGVQDLKISDCDLKRVSSGDSCEDVLIISAESILSEANVAKDIVDEDIQQFPELPEVQVQLANNPPESRVDGISECVDSTVMSAELTLPEANMGEGLVDEEIPMSPELPEVQVQLANNAPENLVDSIFEKFGDALVISAESTLPHANMREGIVNEEIKKSTERLEEEMQLTNNAPESCVDVICEKCEGTLSTSAEPTLSEANMGEGIADEEIKKYTERLEEEVQLANNAPESCVDGLSEKCGNGLVMSAETTLPEANMGNGVVDEETPKSPALHKEEVQLACNAQESLPDGISKKCEDALVMSAEPTFSEAKVRDEIMAEDIPKAPELLEEIVNNAPESSVVGISEKCEDALIMSAETTLPEANMAKVIADENTPKSPELSEARVQLANNARESRVDSPSEKYEDTLVISAEPAFSEAKMREEIMAEDVPKAPEVLVEEVQIVINVSESSVIGISEKGGDALDTSTLSEANMREDIPKAPELLKQDVQLVNSAPESRLDRMYEKCEDVLIISIEPSLPEAAVGEGIVDEEISKSPERPELQVQIANNAPENRKDGISEKVDDALVMSAESGLSEVDLGEEIMDEEIPESPELLEEQMQLAKNASESRVNGIFEMCEDASVMYTEPTLSEAKVVDEMIGEDIPKSPDLPEVQMQLANHAPESRVDGISEKCESALVISAESTLPEANVGDDIVDEEIPTSLELPNVHVHDANNAPECRMDGISEKCKDTLVISAESTLPEANMGEGTVYEEVLKSPELLQELANNAPKSRVDGISEKSENTLVIPAESALPEANIGEGTVNEEVPKSPELPEIQMVLENNAPESRVDGVSENSENALIIPSESALLNANMGEDIPKSPELLQEQEEFANNVPVNRVDGLSVKCVDVLVVSAESTLPEANMGECIVDEEMPKSPVLPEVQGQNTNNAPECRVGGASEKCEDALDPLQNQVKNFTISDNIQITSKLRESVQHVNLDIPVDFTFSKDETPMKDVTICNESEEITLFCRETSRSVNFDVATIKNTKELTMSTSCEKVSPVSTGIPPKLNEPAQICDLDDPKGLISCEVILKNSTTKQFAKSDSNFLSASNKSGHILKASKNQSKLDVSRRRRKELVKCVVPGGLGKRHAAKGSVLSSSPVDAESNNGRLFGSVKDRNGSVEYLSEPQKEILNALTIKNSLPKEFSSKLEQKTNCEFDQIKGNNIFSPRDDGIPKKMSVQIGHINDESSVPKLAQPPLNGDLPMSVQVGHINESSVPKLAQPPLNGDLPMSVQVGHINDESSVPKLAQPPLNGDLPMSFVVASQHFTKLSANLNDSSNTFLNNFNGRRTAVVFEKSKSNSTVDYPILGKKENFNKEKGKINGDLSSQNGFAVSPGETRMLYIGGDGYIVLDEVGTEEDEEMEVSVVEVEPIKENQWMCPTREGNIDKIEDGKISAKNVFKRTSCENPRKKGVGLYFLRINREDPGVSRQYKRNGLKRRRMGNNGDMDAERAVEEKSCPDPRLEHLVSAVRQNLQNEILQNGKLSEASCTKFQLSSSEHINRQTGVLVQTLLTEDNMTITKGRSAVGNCKQLNSHSVRNGGKKWKHLTEDKNISMPETKKQSSEPVSRERQRITSRRSVRWKLAHARKSSEKPTEGITANNEDCGSVKFSGTEIRKQHVSHELIFSVNETPEDELAQQKITLAASKTSGNEINNHDQSRKVVADIVTSKRNIAQQEQAQDISIDFETTESGIAQQVLTQENIVVGDRTFECGVAQEMQSQEKSVVGDGTSECDVAQEVQSQEKSVVNDGTSECTIVQAEQSQDRSVVGDGTSECEVAQEVQSQEKSVVNNGTSECTAVQAEQSQDSYVVGDGISECEVAQEVQSQDKYVGNDGTSVCTAVQAEQSQVKSVVGDGTSECEEAQEEQSQEKSVVNDGTSECTVVQAEQSQDKSVVGDGTSECEVAQEVQSQGKYVGNDGTSECTIVQAEQSQDSSVVGDGTSECEVAQEVPSQDKYVDNDGTSECTVVQAEQSQDKSVVGDGTSECEVAQEVQSQEKSVVNDGTSECTVVQAEQSQNSYVVGDGTSECEVAQEVQSQGKYVGNDGTSECTVVQAEQSQDRSVVGDGTSESEVAQEEKSPENVVGSDETSECDLDQEVQTQEKSVVGDTTSEGEVGQEEQSPENTVRGDGTSECDVAQKEQSPENTVDGDETSECDVGQEEETKGKSVVGVKPSECEVAQEAQSPENTVGDVVTSVCEVVQDEQSQEKSVVGDRTSECEVAGEEQPQEKSVIGDGSSECEVGKEEQTHEKSDVGDGTSECEVCQEEHTQEESVVGDRTSECEVAQEEQSLTASVFNDGTSECEVAQEEQSQEKAVVDDGTSECEVGQEEQTQEKSVVGNGTSECEVAQEKQSQAAYVSNDGTSECEVGQVEQTQEKSVVGDKISECDVAQEDQSQKSVVDDGTSECEVGQEEQTQEKSVVGNGTSECEVAQEEQSQTTYLSNDKTSECDVTPEEQSQKCVVDDGSSECVVGQEEQTQEVSVGGDKTSGCEVAPEVQSQKPFVDNGSFERVVGQEEQTQEASVVGDKTSGREVAPEEPLQESVVDGSPECVVGQVEQTQEASVDGDKTSECEVAPEVQSQKPVVDNGSSERVVGQEEQTQEACVVGDKTSGCEVAPEEPLQESVVDESPECVVGQVEQTQEASVDGDKTSECEVAPEVQSQKPVVDNGSSERVVGQEEQTQEACVVGDKTSECEVAPEEQSQKSVVDDGSSECEVALVEQSEENIVVRDLLSVEFKMQVPSLNGFLKDSELKTSGEVDEAISNDFAAIDSVVLGEEVISKNDVAEQEMNVARNVKDMTIQPGCTWEQHVRQVFSCDAHIIINKCDSDGGVVCKDCISEISGLGCHMEAQSPGRPNCREQSHVLEGSGPGNELLALPESFSKNRFLVYGGKSYDTAYDYAELYCLNIITRCYIRLDRMDESTLQIVLKSKNEGRMSVGLTNPSSTALQYQKTREAGKRTREVSTLGDLAGASLAKQARLSCEEGPSATPYSTTQEEILSHQVFHRRKYTIFKSKNSTNLPKKPASPLRFVTSKDVCGNSVMSVDVRPSEYSVIAPRSKPVEKDESAESLASDKLLPTDHRQSTFPENSNSQLSEIVNIKNVATYDQEQYVVSMTLETTVRNCEDTLTKSTDTVVESTENNLTDTISGSAEHLSPSEKNVLAEIIDSPSDPSENPLELGTLGFDPNRKVYGNPKFKDWQKQMMKEAKEKMIASKSDCSQDKVLSEGIIRRRGRPKKCKRRGSLKGENEDGSLRRTEVEMINSESEEMAQNLEKHSLLPDLKTFLLTNCDELYRRNVIRQCTVLLERLDESVLARASGRKVAESGTMAGPARRRGRPAKRVRRIVGDGRSVLSPVTSNAPLETPATSSGLLQTNSLSPEPPQVKEVATAPFDGSCEQPSPSSSSDPHQTRPLTCTKDSQIESQSDTLSLLDTRGVTVGKMCKARATYPQSSPSSDTVPGSSTQDFSLFPYNPPEIPSSKDTPSVSSKESSSAYSPNRVLPREDPDVESSSESEIMKNDFRSCFRERRLNIEEKTCHGSQKAVFPLDFPPGSSRLFIPSETPSNSNSALIFSKEPSNYYSPNRGPSGEDPSIETSESEMLKALLSEVLGGNDAERIDFQTRFSEERQNMGDQWFSMSQRAGFPPGIPDPSRYIRPSPNINSSSVFFKDPYNYSPRHVLTKEGQGVGPTSELEALPYRGASAGKDDVSAHFLPYPYPDYQDSRSSFSWSDYFAGLPRKRPKNNREAPLGEELFKKICCSIEEDDSRYDYSRLRDVEVDSNRLEKILNILGGKPEERSSSDTSKKDEEDFNGFTDCLFPSHLPSHCTNCKRKYEIAQLDIANVKAAMHTFARTHHPCRTTKERTQQNFPRTHPCRTAEERTQQNLPRVHPCRTAEERTQQNLPRIHPCRTAEERTQVYFPSNSKEERGVYASHLASSHTNLGYPNKSLSTKRPREETDDDERTLPLMKKIR